MRPDGATDVYCVDCDGDERANQRTADRFAGERGWTALFLMGPSSTDGYGKFQNFFEVVSDTANDTDDRTELKCDAFAEKDAAGCRPYGSCFLWHAPDENRRLTISPCFRRIAAQERGHADDSGQGRHQPDLDESRRRRAGDSAPWRLRTGRFRARNLLRISFTASDELSGLRHDGEQVLSEGPHYPTGDGDPSRVEPGQRQLHGQRAALRR